MRVTIFSLAPVAALALVAGVLTSCKDNPADPLADQEVFDRAVLGFSADAMDRSVEVHWGIGFLQSKQLYRSKETHYRLLFSENGLTDIQPVVEGTLGDKFSGSHVFDNLENGRPYYFGIEIVNLAAGAPLSDVVTAVPHTPNPTDFVLTPQPHEQRYAAWSPDGKSIAYVGQVDSTASDTGQEYLWDALFVYDLSSRQSVRYVSHAADLSWSPDSKRLALNIEGRESIISAFDLETQILTHLTDGRSEDHYPSWSPDGLHIVFLRYFAGELNQIWRYNLQDGSSSLLASEATPWAYPSDTFADLSWTLDGNRIIFARRRIERSESARDIYTMDINGGDLRPLVESPWDDHRPVYSPDGRRLAFLSNRSGGTNVWTMDLAAGKLNQITSEPIDYGALSWSADGTEIVFIGYRDHLRTLRTVRVPDHR